jgi:acyl dehydratase
VSRTVPPLQGRSWTSISADDPAGEVRLDVTYTSIAGIVATRDWFPGHHDPGYARGQGRRTIYANTVFFQGLVDRVALEWAGSGWFIHSRTLEMKESVYPGDSLVCRGTVTSKDQSEGLDTVRLQVTIQVNGVDTPAVVSDIRLAASPGMPENRS